VPPPRRAPSERDLVVLVGLCFMLQPLATDAYLPSLPGLAQTFGAGIATVQLTLSLFILTFGALQLVVGPLSDRFGRHPLLVTGITLYFVASIACALAPTLGFLIVARIFQAAGCCTGLAVARAIVRDVFTPQAGARAIAQASSILAAAPLLGPIVGSALEVRFGFRAIFVVLALFAGGLIALTLTRFSETNRHLDPDATRRHTLAATYGRVLRSRTFLAHTLAGAASYGGIFALITGAPFVLIGLLGVPTAYFGLAWAFCVLGYLAGTIVCRRLLARRSIRGTLRIGGLVALAAGAALAGLALAGVHHWAALVGPGFVYFFAHGINFPSAQAGSVAPFPRQAGAAAGLFGFLMMVFAALVGAWVGISYDGTVYPLAFTVTACALISSATAFGWISRLPVAVNIDETAHGSATRSDFG
jgi:DHA1 family bicyclomycin/chloramphenicol resistance-like MFS transporter